MIITQLGFEELCESENTTMQWVTDGPASLLASEHCGYRGTLICLAFTWIVGIVT